MKEIFLSITQCSVFFLKKKFFKVRDGTRTLSVRLNIFQKRIDILLFFAFKQSTKYSSSVDTRVVSQYKLKKIPVYREEGPVLSTLRSVPS